jgi:2-phosphoglycerate kinase
MTDAPGPASTASGATSPLVMLVGGSSCTGKTTLARALAERSGAEHVQVDDLRRGVEDERVRFLARTANPWRRAPEELCERLRQAADALGPLLSRVVEDALRDGRRLVLEGEGVSPQLAASLCRDARVRALFVVELDAKRIARTLHSRSASFSLLSGDEQATVAATNARYCRWLAGECARLGLAGVDSQPWATLSERAEAALTSRSAPAAR